MHLIRDEKHFSEFAIPEEWKVPHGTHEKLLIYFGLVQKWNPKINLVSEKTLDTKNFWKRHALDSLQLIHHIKNNDVVCDIGSGGGFPALILAAAGFENLHLVESDLRKCEFLKEAARQMNVKVTIHNTRAEALKTSDIGGSADVITARACAELKELLEFSFHLATKATRFVLLKGKQAEQEIDTALKIWTFDYKLTPSITDSASHIITLSNLSKRREHGTEK